MFWAGAWAADRGLDDRHPEWRWRTVRTEHFRIHHPVGGASEAEATAVRVAAVVEPLWDRLTTVMEHTSRVPVDIVVIDEADTLQGFALPQQSVVLFSANPGPELARMRGQEDWVPDLLAHELAHVIGHRKGAWLPRALTVSGLELGGVVEEGPVQAGVRIGLEVDQPYWFSEGSAEYFSEAVGVNRWTPARAMTLRASVLDGRWLPADRWGNDGLNDGWYDSERAYQQGYSFLRWFVGRHGQQALLGIFETAARRPLERIETHFATVTGVPFERLWKAHQLEVAAEVGRQVAGLASQGIVEGEELLQWERDWTSTEVSRQDRFALQTTRQQRDDRESTGTLNLHHTFSDDGTWTAQHRAGWTVVKRLHPSMYTAFAGRTPSWERTADQRARSYGESLWIPSRYSSDLDFIPGADALVVVGREGDGRRRRQRYDHTQLFRVDLSDAEHFPEDARKRMHPIPGTLRATSPSVAPDGSRLAWVRFDAGGVVLMVGALEGPFRTLAAFPEGAVIQGTDWSPDGERIVASVFERGRQHLWAFREDGSRERLVGGGGQVVDPYWAADGSLWFSTEVEGISDIFRWRSQQGVERITRVRTGAAAPTLTPDGDLVYAHYTAFGWKSYGLPRRAWLHEPVELAEVALAEVLPAEPSRDSSPYRPAFGVPSIGPFLRLDRTPDGVWRPRVGARVRLEDALRKHVVAVRGWAGADQGLYGSYDLLLGPDLGVSAGRTWLGGDTLDRAAASLGWSIVDGIEVELGVAAFRQGAHSSRMVTLGLDLGTAFRRDPWQRSNEVHVLGTMAWSKGVRPGPYQRVEVYGSTVRTAPFLREHRLELAIAGALSSRAVALEDRLRVGDDQGYAMRPAVYQASIPAVGYGPFSFAGDHLAVGGLEWRSPLARRLGERLGPWVLDEIHLGLRGGGGVVVHERTEGLAGLGLRLGAGVFGPGGRTESGLEFAWGRPTTSHPGGPRAVWSIGTDW